MAFTSLTILTLGSCEKKQCYTCTLTVTYTGSPMPSTNSTTTHCDLTKDDKEAIENAGTSKATSGGVTVNQKMSCR